MKNLNSKVQDNIILVIVLVILIGLISLLSNSWDNNETIENNEITSSNFEKFKFKEKVADGFIYENLKGEILFIDDQDSKVYKVSNEIKVQFDDTGYEIEKIITN